MDPSWTPVLAWSFAVLLIFMFVPPLAMMALRRIQHSRRQKMVNGPRKIKVAREDDVSGDPCAARGHQRSKRNVREGADGVYVSVCRTCGVRMRRNGPGDWEAVG